MSDDELDNPPLLHREHNVELLRRFIQAFHARDLDAMLALVDPSIEWYSAFGVGGDVYRGHDGIRNWYRDMEDAWGDELRVEPDVYFDLGQDTLMFYVAHGRGEHSRAEVAMPIATVFRWRDGLIVYFKGYPDREDALRDLGVSEDELEPIDP
jgi:ketosteroid isomerase-like protein